jgi:L-threonylcarbamoyladenylate synthase
MEKLAGGDAHAVDPGIVSRERGCGDFLWVLSGAQSLEARSDRRVEIRVKIPTVLPTHTAQLFEAAVRQAAEVLRAGEVVALPTETVYGLAANALDERAVSRIFEIKGRPAHNPLIVHVAGFEMARRCVREWPELADKLAASFWPGPLTMVIERSSSIPAVVTAGGPTVGLRWPSHPFIQAVIRECGFPLAAPSANLSNQLSPTSPDHVVKSLGSRIALIVDGGQCQIGIESTVLDLSARPPRVLRPGMIHEETLAAVIGELSAREENHGATVKSPGMLPKHYAPRAKLTVLRWQNEGDLRDQLLRRGKLLADCHVIAHTKVPSANDFERVSVIPHDAEAFARALYTELHRCDEAGVELIIVEAVPETSEWNAIADRLRRASSA